MLLASKDNIKMYSRILISISLCIALTLFVSSTIYVVSFARILSKQVYTHNIESLMKTSQEVANMTNDAQSLSFQLYRDISINKLLYYSNPDIFDFTAAMEQLNNYRNSMPFIDSIYIVNEKSESVIISSRKGQNGTISRAEMDDQDILRVLGRFREYKPFVPIPRNYTPQSSAKGKASVYTYLCYDAIGVENGLNSALVVNVNASWINKDIGKHDEETIGKSFIMDNQGHLLSGDELSPASSDKTILDRIVNDADSGYFVGAVDGVKSLISYTAADALEWRYVRITPYSAITDQIKLIIQRTFLVGLGILIAGLLAAWILSRHLYTPIRLILMRRRAWKPINETACTP